MTFYTNSAIHMLAHSAWAQVLMFMGAAELGLAHGKLHSRWWKLATPVALAVTGLAFLVHEQNDWLFARSAFLHHLLGWTLVFGALVPLALVFRPRSVVLQSGFAVVIIAVAVMLYCDRDVAPIFGHLSPLAGPPPVRRLVLAGRRARALRAGGGVGARVAASARRRASRSGSSDSPKTVRL